MPVRFSKRHTALAVSALLALATLLVYWPLLSNDFIHYDDQEYVTENPAIKSGFTKETLLWAFTTNHAANWHPVTWLSHMLDWQLFGPHAWGHHFVNLLLHTANSVLVFWLLRNLTGAFWRSAVVAALFALHPLHVESVAWVAERKDVLSALFALLCLLEYTRYGRSEPAKLRIAAAPVLRFPRSLHYWLALCFLALGLMSKPMLVTIPFVLLLLDFWPLERVKLKKSNAQNSTFRHWRPVLIEKIPFLLLAAASALVTLLVQAPAMSFYNQLPLSARAANALVSCARYIGKIGWPAHLAVLYPHPGRWPLGLVLSSAILLILLLALAFRTRRRWPFLAVGILWFLGMLVPVLGLVQVGAQSMADRYAYLPSIGFFIAAVWSAAEIIRRFALPSFLAPALSLILLFACCAQTRGQLAAWRNTETIFTHALAVTKGNWSAHYNLGVFYLLKYQQEARSSVESQAVGSTASGPTERSRRDFLAEAQAQCEAALALRPGLADIHVTLAKVLTERGLLQPATAHLQTAIRLAPDNPEAHENLAEIFYRNGRTLEAVSEYRRALELKPGWDSVLNNLAWLLATSPSAEVRNGPEAVQLAGRANQLQQGTNIWLLHTLAAAYAEAGEFNLAVSTARKALEAAARTAQPQLIETARQRLELYQSQRPLRDP